MNLKNLVRGFPQHYWKGLLVILVAYTVLQFIYYYPTNKLPDFLRSLPVSPVWFFLLIILFIGALILKQSGVGWLLTLWIGYHLLLIFLLMVIFASLRLGDWPSHGLSSSFFTIVELLISPLPYLAAGLLHKISV